MQARQRRAHVRGRGGAGPEDLGGGGGARPDDGVEVRGAGLFGPEEVLAPEDACALGGGG